ncbi:unnamed protein product [Parascedosporium putredinis]|uniref:PD-(D/E)XK nuclease-like domain-containing protein n=1 Tax=Parascedosporium putredinis TaxID=1442378 RepID=A0A9P1GZL8_9PEZI|nr:unnamed protein product [Parascedosporium putredinis]CAI7991918.1 unnamed protein product [Parascedosporium putredinis]
MRDDQDVSTPPPKRRRGLVSPGPERRDESAEFSATDETPRASLSQRVAPVSLDRARDSTATSSVSSRNSQSTSQHSRASSPRKKLTGLALRDDGVEMLTEMDMVANAVGVISEGRKLVGFDECSTAGIIKEYVPCSASGKKVDFCIYVDPSYSTAPESSRQISTLRRSLPLHSINITDLEAVNKTPIAVSIETKRANAALDQAELQIGVWQAAQWNMLEALVTQRVARSVTASGAQGVGGVEHKVAEALERLPFLPALIVHGHEWKLAATTREGKKTVRIPKALC